MAREDHADLLEALAAIDPASLSYQEWVDCGMALHESGFGWQDWEAWSRRDPARFHEGECERKFMGFGKGLTRVTSGTIVEMARQRGWEPRPCGDDAAFGWDDEIPVVPDPSWIEDRPLDDAGGAWDPARQLSDYLAALFDDDDHVGYVVESRDQDGRWVPSSGGSWKRRAGRLRDELAGCGGDIGAVLGDWREEAGAWIRFNPLDGKGCGNANVTEYRYALVESDTLPVEKQQGMIEAMNLPCAAIVSSGGKSVHAIVRIDAGTDYDLYRRRVEKLYRFCREHGFEPDTQNKNPSRLSRMPGATRGGRRQALLAVNTGAESWSAWEDWVAESQDDLPDTESLADIWDDPPELSAPLIGTEGRGILRHGHKMLIAGPSKAGKSMLLMELAIAIGEGGTWCGYPCARGRVLYVNLEIDRASCYDRFKRISDDRQRRRPEGPVRRPGWLANVDVWNLRGKAVPMDQLAPRLIHRASGKGYAAIIIDPLYKVITRDENNASEMAAFCNQFDKVCSRLGTAVIYCHHHSKGAQGAKKSIDRASGSGVFGRDPDALIDLAPLEMPESEAAKYAHQSFWRMDATLREFEAPEPINLVFRYPVHLVDASGEARRWKVEGEDPYAERNRRRDEAKAAKQMADQQEKNALVREALAACAEECLAPTRENVLEQIGELGGEKVSEGQLKRWTTPSKSPWAEFQAVRDRDGRWLVEEIAASDGEAGNE